ncbi:hypothetical protein TNCV_2601471 [Trichonephila clavipes]|nr:hypothetical protein TNCV_2601471 [Trichonephila clavipes]
MSRRFPDGDLNPGPMVWKSDTLPLNHWASTGSTEGGPERVSLGLQKAVELMKKRIIIIGDIFATEKNIINNFNFTALFSEHLER